MSDIQDFFGGGVGGDVGIFPTFPNQILTGFPASNALSRMQGFVGDGDFIQLPVNENASIDYLDIDEVSQSGWPITPAAASTGADAWLGFMLDGSVLYATLVDLGTTPNTIHTVSINSAGVITSIGTAQLTVDFPDNNWWANGANGRGTSMYRDSFGSGNFNVIQFTDLASNVASREIIINSGSGALIQGTPTLISKNNDNYNYKYKTPSGVYVGHFDATTSGSSVHMSGPLGVHTTVIPSSTGVGAAANTTIPMMWVDFISYGNGFSVADRGSVKQNTYIGFNESIDTIARNVGILA